MGALNKLTVLMSLTLLSACADHTIKNIPTTGYDSASEFAYESIKVTTCMGSIDSLIFPAGDIVQDKIGIKTFIANSYSGTHCNRGDFKKAMGSYCFSRGGGYKGDWCVRDDKPIFLVTNFDVMEKSKGITDGEWGVIARKNLGFISEKESIDYEIIKKLEEKEKEKEKEKRESTSVIANVGDFICKDDNENKYTKDSLYYGGFVEGKENGKIKIRIKWHGGKNTVVKNEWAGDNIIWSSPRGWFQCSEKTIGNLP